MARGNSQAQSAATSGLGLSNTLQGNAEGLYSQLAPELATQATHPSGFSPTDLAKMDTAAEQSAGGSQAAATGQGALLASRTRNPGAAAAAIAEGARSAGRNLSNAALDTQLANANLKSKQQAQALGEEGQLYGTDVSGANQGLGEVASNVNANTNAENASWDWAKDIMDPILSAAGASSGTILKAAGG